MKTLVLIVFLVLAPAVVAQTECTPPPGYQCITQELANKLFDSVQKLIVANEAIEKLKVSSQTGDVALAQSLKVIKGWEEVEVINGKIQVKYEQMLVLYEKVITMYQNVVERLEKQLAKPKSPLDKFFKALKEIALITTGIILGRGL